MGTYRQPSQVIDKSLSVANQGMQNTATQMERGLARRRQQQLLDAKEIQRKNGHIRIRESALLIITQICSQK